MHFNLIAIALALSASQVAAAPAAEAGLEKRIDNGVCNGTSCRWGFTNYKCASGTSCVGTGGGDGAACTRTSGTDFQCPVKTS
ncbi:hypothetical protein GTA08_BOTSDO12981 [Botryosphaeria dothidea]|uniref:Bubble protein protein n=1 Tax=Botryosphaeria dothidea TaxID=55169 RepID=A0A8H4NDY3_9PEZI|nr:hypothetical protein GTA08_BOTSDO12981 [Botryosphaeria dothidea]